MLPKISSLIALALWLAFAGISRAQDLSAFFDAYEKAAAQAVSVTARVACRTYIDGEASPVHFTGVATWGGGSRPFAMLTLVRKDNSKDTSGTFLVVIRDDTIRIVDCAHSQYYEEKLAQRGASLLSQKVNIVFVLFAEPHVLDLFRDMPSNLTKTAAPSGDTLNFVGDDSSCHLELAVNSATYMPLKVERTVKNQNGRAFKSVLEITDIAASKSRCPDVVFDINGAFGFPTAFFDPTGLLSLDKAPLFEVVTLDGNKFNLSEHAGKWVFLCFRAQCDRLRGEAEDCLDRDGELVRSHGGYFINVIPSGYGVGQSSIISLSSICRSDVVARIYAVKNVGLPFVVAISPEGVVKDVFIGYIPSVSERAFAQFVENNMTGDPAK